MLKRVLLAFMLVVGLIAMQGDVRAHLAGTVYSPTYRHISSYDCTGTFAQVPSLTQHPASFECAAVVREYELACANPQGKVNAGRSGPVSVLQVASSLLTEADITDKIKGKASKTILLPDTVLAAANALCKARNRNWSAADELVTSVDVWIRSYDCLDSSCSVKDQAFESLLHCTRPVCPNGQPCSIPDNPPPGVPGAPVPTEYPCTLIAESHCDAGDPCPIIP